jgi:hypothetical protein
MPGWLRIVLVIGIVLLVAGAGLFSYIGYSRPGSTLTGSRANVLSRNRTGRCRWRTRGRTGAAFGAGGLCQPIPVLDGRNGSSNDTLGFSSPTITNSLHGDKVRVRMVRVSDVSPVNEEPG